MPLIENWKLVVLERYTKFDGRAGQGEFWWFHLANLIIGIVLGVLSLAIHWVFWAVFVVYALAVLIPSIAVSIRRLHDTDKSGWWLLIGFIPLGGLVLLIFYIMSGDPRQNKYGNAPEPAA